MDTCCIDKTSSAELTEPINSMFKWYGDASVCYAYLEDVHNIFELDTPNEQDFARSAWFSRGWTLQELIAPKHIVFYANGWNYIDTRDQLAEHLSAITHIHIDVLRKQRPLRSYTIAQRFAWAAGRRTTRVEDEAYSLLGIFDVNMPLLYGEGSKALRRLQEEILRRTTELSILAWNSNLVDGASQALATSTSQFQACQDIVLSETKTIAASSQVGVVAGNTAFYLTAKVLLVPGGDGFGNMLAVLLDCRYQNDITTVIGLRITPLKSKSMSVLSQTGRIFCSIGWRGHPDNRRVVMVDALQACSAQVREVVVNFDTVAWSLSSTEGTNWTHVWVRFSYINTTGQWMTKDLLPRQYWTPSNRTFDLQRARADKLKDNNHKSSKVNQSCSGLPVIGSIVLVHLSGKMIRLAFRQTSPSLETGMQYAIEPYEEVNGEESRAKVDFAFGTKPCALPLGSGTRLEASLRLERIGDLRIALLGIGLVSGTAYFNLSEASFEQNSG